MAKQLLTRIIADFLKQQRETLPDKSENKLSYHPVDKKRTIYLEYKTDDPIGTLHESFMQKKSLKKVHHHYEEGVQMFQETLKGFLGDKSRKTLLKFVGMMILLTCWSLSMAFGNIDDEYTLLFSMAMCVVSYVLLGLKFIHWAMNLNCISRDELEAFARDYSQAGGQSSFSFNVYKNHEKQYLEVKMVGKARTKKKSTEMLFVIYEEPNEEEKEEVVDTHDNSLQELGDSD